MIVIATIEKMSSVLILTVIFIFSYIGYKLYKIKLLKNRLSWLPFVPTWPIVGNGLEFGDTSGKNIKNMCGVTHIDTFIGSLRNFTSDGEDRI